MAESGKAIRIVGGSYAARGGRVGFPQPALDRNLASLERNGGRDCMEVQIMHELATCFELL